MKNIKLSIISGVVLSTGLLTNTAFAKEDITETNKTFNGTVKQTVTSKQDIKKALKQLPKKYAIVENLDKYVVKEVSTDEKGFKHYTLIPKVNNVEVLSQVVKVHVNKNGKVVMVNGNIDQENIVPTNQVKINKEAAIANAFNAIGTSQVKVSNIDKSSPINEAKLYVSAEDKKYVYQINLSYTSPEPANWFITVDAQTGQIIKKQNKLRSMTNYVGRGIGVNGAYKPVGLVEDGGIYYLADYSQPTKLETYSAAHTTTTTKDVTDTDKYLRDFAQRPAVDAAYYSRKVYDYYKNVHGRESYDGNGAPIYTIVNYDSNYNNAAWTGKAMIYGDGDGEKFGPLSASLDITAHELTHAVTGATAKLEYHTQSGALDEHVADAFGFFVDPEDFSIAEDIYTPKIPNDGGLRNFDNPEAQNRPGHMDEYWDFLADTEEEDWGGVHINATILNKALYYTIHDEQLDVKKAEKIYYRALTNYFTPWIQFTDAKQALMRAARDLYTEEDAQKINRGWNKVGIY
ncbi:M4 family metallopeptidase [Macrococcus armenti]|uniref:M4 family metallopeptidase n=1 Tax=Macrococcus armenti TaxID=2875764 RepID=UPI001CCDFD25|nr:M4 family metallopeptidase [Macrococcus armenti]UBH12957.1 M4 family metallopeptidase [Macrococcus armenti]UBH22197.1 M4 family metallopeptidase [Macrococcus armenti]